MFAMNCPETVIIRGEERVSWGDRWVWRGAMPPLWPGFKRAKRMRRAEVASH